MKLLKRARASRLVAALKWDIDQWLGDYDSRYDARHAPAPAAPEKVDACIACDGDGSDHLHPDDPDSHPCRVCGGTGIGS